jgi:DNA-binding NtrC family response regulator
MADGGLDILGQCAAMVSLRSLLPAIAASSGNVLIVGERGTGRSKVAAKLAALAAARLQDFDPAEPGVEGWSLLRGGSGGVSHLTAEQQVMLARRLSGQNGDGAARPGRIVTLAEPGIWMDLAAGTVRGDLFHRLAEITVFLPPLRHRGGDLELLVGAFLREFSATYSKDFTGVSPGALRRLSAHPFPGNVRELRMLLEPIVALQAGPVLTEDMLPPDLGATLYLGTDRPVAPEAAAAEGGGMGGPLVSATAARTTAQTESGEPISTATVTPFSDDIIPLAVLERRAVEHALRLCGGSVEAAAERLGLTVAALRRKLGKEEQEVPG